MPGCLTLPALRVSEQQRHFVSHFWKYMNISSCLYRSLINLFCNDSQSTHILWARFTKLHKTLLQPNEVGCLSQWALPDSAPRLTFFLAFLNYSHSKASKENNIHLHKIYNGNDLKLQYIIIIANIITLFFTPRHQRNLKAPVCSCTSRQMQQKNVCFSLY